MQVEVWVGSGRMRGVCVWSRVGGVCMCMCMSNVRIIVYMHTMRIVWGHTMRMRVCI